MLDKVRRKGRAKDSQLEAVPCNWCSRISSCKSSYYQVGLRIRRSGDLNKRPLTPWQKTRCSKNVSALMNITMENLNQMASSQDTLALKPSVFYLWCLFNYSQPDSLAMALWEIPHLCVSSHSYLPHTSPAFHCGLRRKPTGLLPVLVYLLKGNAISTLHVGSINMAPTSKTELELTADIYFSPRQTRRRQKISMTKVGRASLTQELLS